jgi:hypothetical protein
MDRSSRVALFAGCLMAAASLARAQESVPPLSARSVAFAAAPIIDLSREQDSELRQWLAAMTKFRRAHPGPPNTLAHGMNGSIVARKVPPAAPPWLFEYCADGHSALRRSSGPLGEGCRLIAASPEAVAAQVSLTQVQKQRAAHERVQHSSFFSRLHLDGLWTTPATGVRSYGLLGSHISLVDLGRLQSFGPPGLLLLLVPDGTGSRSVRVGYTWGFSVRLADMKLLAPTKNVTLFVTVSKCWIAGGDRPGNGRGAMDLVGFSIAPRKSRH